MATPPWGRRPLNALSQTGEWADGTRTNTRWVYPSVQADGPLRPTSPDGVAVTPPPHIRKQPITVDKLSRGDGVSWPWPSSLLAGAAAVPCGDYTMQPPNRGSSTPSTRSRRCRRPRPRTAVPRAPHARWAPPPSHPPPAPTRSGLRGQVRGVHLDLGSCRMTARSSTTAWRGSAEQEPQARVAAAAAAAASAIPRLLQEGRQVERPLRPGRCRAARSAGDAPPVRRRGAPPPHAAPDPPADDMRADRGAYGFPRPHAAPGRSPKIRCSSRMPSARCRLFTVAAVVHDLAAPRHLRGSTGRQPAERLGDAGPLPGPRVPDTRFTSGGQ